jgi:hypothetical protein
MIKTPVCFFIFKRSNSLPLIAEKMKKAGVEKLYVLGDGPRNDTEVSAVDDARSLAKKLFSWSGLEVIFEFNQTNRGVYNQIVGGAKKILAKEGQAIFLEDDNDPDVTFFRFCENMLSLYEDDKRVLWVCGSNYFNDIQPDDGDYFFSQQLLPCGWASWGEKFLKYYDGDLSFLGVPHAKSKLRKKYKYDRCVFEQQWSCFKNEIFYMKNYGHYFSWDYQMALSIKENDLFGIVPKTNLITNIGIDQFATHGGSKKGVMTNRFCGIPSIPLSFPLISPSEIKISPKFEKRIARCRKTPTHVYFFGKIRDFVRRRILLLRDDQPVKSLFHRKK